MAKRTSKTSAKVAKIAAAKRVAAEAAKPQHVHAHRLADGLGNVLLVGHEPDFSDAVAELTGGRVKLRKGGIAEAKAL